MQMTELTDSRKDFPAIKLILLFAAGILLNRFFQVSIYYFAAMIVTSAALYFLSLKYPLIILRNINSILLLIAVLVFGNVTAQLNQPGYNYLSEDIYRLKNIRVIGEITNIELPRKEEIVFEMESSSIQSGDTVQNEKINFICRISELIASRKDAQSKLDSIYSVLAIGNKVAVEGNYSKGREERNPGEFDYNKYLRSKGVSGIINIYNTSNLPAGQARIKIINNRENVFANTILTIRKKIDLLIRKLYNEQSAGLLRGLLLADRSEISYDTKTEFINTGVIHILAVSGLHVGYIVLIFTFLFGRFNIYTGSLLTVLGLTIYIILIGAPSSAFRAGVMSVVLITAFITNRSTNLLNSIAIAALIILFIKPYELFAPGFQLSFAAVISIALIYPPIQNGIKKIEVNNLIKNILLFVGVSLAAQIGTMPITIFYFGKLSLVALFTNLIVIPSTGVIVGIGILSLALGAFFNSIAPYFSVVNELVIKFIFWIIHITGSGDYSFLRIRNFSLYDIILFYLVLAAIFIFHRRFVNSSAKITLLALCTSVFYLFSTFDNKNLLPDNKLSVVMIDVGQGDSFILKFPDGRTALIDAGEATYSFDNGERVVLPLLDHLGIDKIDYGFVTHLDMDHYGGFVSLIRSGKISRLYKPGLDTSLSKDVRFENYIDKSHIPKKYYKREILKIGNVRVYVLNVNEFKNSIQNNRSGVLKIVYGNSEFLFTGDIESLAENYYAEKYKTFLDSDVLKVGHHGSSTSSTENFLQFVTPQISLISVGIQNKFNHPSQVIIDRLKKYHSKIFRTDRAGAVILQSDGETIMKADWRE